MEQKGAGSERERESREYGPRSTAKNISADSSILFVHLIKCFWNRLKRFKRANRATSWKITRFKTKKTTGFYKYVSEYWCRKRLEMRKFPKSCLGLMVNGVFCVCLVAERDRSRLSSPRGNVCVWLHRGMIGTAVHQWKSSCAGPLQTHCDISKAHPSLAPPPSTARPLNIIFICSHAPNITTQYSTTKWSITPPHELGMWITT